jgi:hypothetical protein
MQYTNAQSNPLEATSQPHRLPEYAGLGDEAHPQDQDFVDYVREMTEAWEAPAADSAQA